MSNATVAVTTIDPMIITLNLIQLNIGRYLYPVIVTLGNIGSILNVLILTQRVYLHNSCACYILAASIINVFIINIVAVTHLLALGFSIDPTTTSVFFCKFRFYIAHIITLLSRFCMVLACVDRWAMSSTSTRRRAFSQKKVANILIPSLSIGICIISIHILIYSNIINGRCVMTPPAYSMFYNLYNTLLSGFLVPTLMIIFGFLTIRNVKLSRQRVNVQINTNHILVNQQANRFNGRSREYGILMMTLVQLGVYLIACLPFPMFLVYSTVTIYQTKSTAQLAIDKFLSTIAYVMTNINFCATFYIYILTSRVFRKDLKRILVENHLFKIFRDIQRNQPALGTGNDHPIRTVTVEMNQRKIFNIQP